MSVVQLEDVTKRYRNGDGWSNALSAVNLSVERGSIQGIIGFSGAGKSTLLRCVSRLEKPDEGRVLIDGADLASATGRDLRSARRKLGVVFQQFHLMRSRTVADNIALPLEIAGERPMHIHSRVQDLLGYVGLQDKQHVYPAQLSGGQRQRVAIARALATKPAVLLTDEPTSALDPETTASVLDLLKRVRDELGVTILLITHELNAVRAICDYVAVLDSGCIVEQGPVEQVFTRPMSRATERLLGKDLHLSQLATHLGKPSDHPDSVFLEIHFFGADATDHILFDVARSTDATFSILHAQIVNLNRLGHGSMLVEVSGTVSALATVQDRLRARGANVVIVEPWQNAPFTVSGHA